jgi:hypothetical protein
MDRLSMTWGYVDGTAAIRRARGDAAAESLWALHRSLRIITRRGQTDPDARPVPSPAAETALLVPRNACMQRRGP